LFLLADPDDLLPDALPPAVFDFFDAPLEGDLLAAVVLPLEPLFELALLLEPVLLFDLADVFDASSAFCGAADRLPFPDALLPELFAVPVFDCAFFPPDDVFAAPVVLLREPAEVPLTSYPLRSSLTCSNYFLRARLAFVLRPFRGAVACSHFSGARRRPEQCASRRPANDLRDNILSPIHYVVDRAALCCGTLF
jgi:hypothetical protein